MVIMAFEENEIVRLTNSYTHIPILKSERIAQSGSSRIYTRVFLRDGSTLMAAYNSDLQENNAFFVFTDFFLNEKIRVPEVLAVSKNKQYYLLTDLGDETLYSYLVSHRNGADVPEEVLRFYRKVLQQLPLLQLCGKKNFDFSACYPRFAFDRQSMQWDLNYFKYYFLKLAHIPFDEQALENDFNTLINFLLEADCDFFLYRDFQSRNIMIKDDEIYFIDYQGGRKGSLQYDVASLLYDAKADLPEEIRSQLLDYYLDELQKHILIDRAETIRHYYGYVLIRIMQAMGAYGYRGYYEKKSHFLQSIPFAVANIKYILDNDKVTIEIPALKSALRHITEIDWGGRLEGVESMDDAKLTVVVSSFSYKKGIPQDNSTHGGGFVFDCRALPNPGRLEPYKTMNGRDQAVKDYLEQYDTVHEFKQHVFAIVDMSVDNYLERKFSHLCINFGCTGGQHRSVYFAQSTADHLQKKYPDVHVVLRHTNL